MFHVAAGEDVGAVRGVAAGEDAVAARGAAAVEGAVAARGASEEPAGIKLVDGRKGSTTGLANSSIKSKSFGVGGEEVSANGKEDSSKST